MVGVIITILFTIKPPNSESFKTMTCSNNTNVLFWVILFASIVSLCFFLTGIYHSFQALIARSDVNLENSDSMIFFGSIAKQQNSQNYLLEVNKFSYNYRKDLTCQIYINSKICTNKFESYNKGFKCIFFSLPIFIICWSYLF